PPMRNFVRGFIGDLGEVTKLTRSLRVIPPDFNITVGCPPGSQRSVRLSTALAAMIPAASQTRSLPLALPPDLASRISFPTLKPELTMLAPISDADLSAPARRSPPNAPL